MYMFLYKYLLVKAITLYFFALVRSLSQMYLSKLNLLHFCFYSSLSIYLWFGNGWKPHDIGSYKKCGMRGWGDLSFLSRYR